MSSMSMPTPAPQRTSPIVWIAAVLLPLAIAWQVREFLRHPEVWPPCDYVEYWSAARLWMSGGNPYSPQEMWLLQQQAGTTTDHVVMLWNPPYVLPLLAWLAWFDPRVGQLLWLLMNLTVSLYCADRLWRHYAQTSERRGAAWLLMLTFAPTVFLFYMGNWSSLLWLGLTGFLTLRTRQRPLLAGMLGALTAIKPHLFSLFAWVLLLEALAHRDGRRVCLGGILTLGLLSGIVTAVSPNIWSQWRDLNRMPGSDILWTAEEVLHPTLGYGLRALVAWVAADHFWVQVLPCSLGLPLTTIYWWRRRPIWDWNVELPRLTFASLLLTPYGAWVYDYQVLLLVLLPAWHRVLSQPDPLIRVALGFVWLNANLGVIGRIGQPGAQQSPWLVLTIVVLVGLCWGVQRSLERAASTTTKTAAPARPAEPSSG